MTDRYPEEDLNEGYTEDDGTIPENVDTIRQAVVGHKIVKAEKISTPMTDRHAYRRNSEFVITLDNGTQVMMTGSDDCCAYTELDSFLLHPELVEHVITGVGTTNGATVWHIYADMGDVLELNVGWSSGNPFYYGYGFYIEVREKEAGE